MLTVDELVLAFRMMESQAEYWVASKILVERNGEDSSTAQEKIDFLTPEIDFLINEKKRLIAHGFLGTC